MSSAKLEQNLMKLETGHPICSLCKRELTSSAFDSTPGTKLCEGCRGLVQTAFHRAEPRMVGASNGAQLSAIATTYVPGARANAPTAISPEPGSVSFLEDFSTFSDAPEQGQSSGSPNPACESFDMHFDDERSTTPDSQETPVVASVIESTDHHEKTSGTIPQSIEAIHSGLNDLRHSFSDYGTANALSENTNSNGHSKEYSKEYSKENAFSVASEESIPADYALAEAHDVQSVTEDTPIDPWEDPLPAWDYSRSEWPVLMGPPREKSFARFKVPIAVALILAVGAGFYYLIYPQISRDQSAATSFPADGKPVSGTATQKPAEPVPQVQGQASSSLSQAPASEPSPPKPIDGSSNASEPGATANSNAQGRFALQAASFPTQAGADELAGKLKAVGVPAYVVSADLARRGRWFRVRVGRFNTGEDAQRFAGEAQQRAKAAGISLQLVISQYDQP